MRRLPVHILVGLLAFLIGVGLVMNVSHLWNRPFSMCRIAAEPAIHDQKIVRVRADLYVSPNGLVQLNGSECGLRSDAWADVAFISSPALIEELRQLADGENVAKTQVVLTGKFEDRHGSCFSARFAINEAELEQASQVSIVNFPEAIQKEDANTKK